MINCFTIGCLAGTNHLLWWNVKFTLNWFYYKTYHANVRNRSEGFCKHWHTIIWQCHMASETNFYYIPTVYFMATLFRDKLLNAFYGSYEIKVQTLEFAWKWSYWEIRRSFLPKELTVLLLANTWWI